VVSNLVITNPKQLSTLIDKIHDCWFSVDDIVFYEDTSVLEIKFAREVLEKKKVVGRILFLKRVQVPFFESFLRIHHVEAYKIDDKEKVGTYDFNKLEYIPAKQEVSVSTGVPIEITAKVKTFEVSLEETEREIKKNTVLSLFG